MIDGGSVNWEELLEPAQPESVAVSVCADASSVALPVVASALAVSLADQVGAGLQKWAVSYFIFCFIKHLIISIFFVQVGTSDLNLAGDILEGPKTLLAMRAGNSLSSKFFDIYFSSTSKKGWSF